MQIAAKPYAFPVRADLSPSNAALLCIDLQGDFCSRGGFMDALGLSFSTMRKPLGNVARLQIACRAAGIAVIHTREGFSADLGDVQPNRLWRGDDGLHPIVGDSGPLGRYLIRGEPGWQILPEVCPATGEAVFDKPGYGTFGRSCLHDHLQRLGINNLIVCGVTSDCCVHLTVQEALDRGYDCLTVSDASAAAFDTVHQNLMQQIERKGGVFGAVTDTATIVSAIAQDTIR